MKKKENMFFENLYTCPDSKPYMSKETPETTEKGEK